jgi:hypothetical protein
MAQVAVLVEVGTCRFAQVVRVRAPALSQFGPTM